MMPVVIILLGGVISGLLLILFTVFLCKVCRCTCHQVSLDGSSIDSKYINCSREMSSNNLEGMACSVSGISHEAPSQNTGAIVKNNSPTQIACETVIPCKPRQFTTSFSVNKPSFADIVLAVAKEKRQANRPRRFRSALNHHKSPHISKLRSSSYNTVCQPMIYPKTDSIESKASTKSFLFPPETNKTPSVSKSFDFENYNLEKKTLIDRVPASFDLVCEASLEYMELMTKEDLLISDKLNNCNKNNNNNHYHNSSEIKFPNEFNVPIQSECSRARLKQVTKLNTWTLSQDTSFNSDDSNEKINEKSLQSSPYSMKINDSGYRSVNQSSSPTNGMFDFSLTIPEFGNSRSSFSGKQRTASCKRKSFSKQKINRKD